MKRIVVGSIWDAQQFVPSDNEHYAVLSFIDVGVEVPGIPRHAGLVERLVIHADDCFPDDPPFNGRRLCPLSEAQAKQVARFVHANADRVDTLFVHCHAGLSRSPGAALAISEVLAIAEIEMINGDQIIPNTHVRDLVHAAMQAQRKNTD